ncbi:MAG: aldo/keto reductase [Rhodobacteraceae bacterium]|nr:aldo/keto reductase [Paracoccaceae bacterium]
MQRVSISGDLTLSRLVYGMWRLANDHDTSASHVAAKIHACLDQGITTVDQAAVYGGYTAERLLGDALRAERGLRSKLEIITKCDIVVPTGRHADKRHKHYDTSRQHILDSVDASLQEMGIDEIDLLLIHRSDPFMDHHETGAVLDELVASGKVRSVGASNFKSWDWELLQSVMTTALATNQIELSLCELEPFTNGDVAFMQRHGAPIMAWSPLGGGRVVFDEASLADGMLGQHLDDIAAQFSVDRAAVAVAFLLAHPANILPVLGTNNLERIARISDALKVNLDRETWFALYQAGLGHEVP